MKIQCVKFDESTYAQVITYRMVRQKLPSFRVPAGLNSFEKFVLGPKRIFICYTRKLPSYKISILSIKYHYLADFIRFFQFIRANRSLFLGTILFRLIIHPQSLSDRTLSLFIDYKSNVAYLGDQKFCVKPRFPTAHLKEVDHVSGNK